MVGSGINGLKKKKYFKDELPRPNTPYVHKKAIFASLKEAAII